VIPTRFLNLPMFVGLLERAEEDGFQGDGGLERGEDFLVYFGFFGKSFGWVIATGWNEDGLILIFSFLEDVSG